VREVALPQYAHVQRYAEWMPLDVRGSVYDKELSREGEGVRSLSAHEVRGLRLHEIRFVAAIVRHSPTIRHT